MSTHPQLLDDPSLSDERRWWWLSFCDPERPAGTQFLGVCIVRGGDVVEATRAAHRLGCNPGGEVCGFETPAAFSPGSEWTNRLLTRADCEAFDRAIGGPGEVVAPFAEDALERIHLTLVVGPESAA